ncbi:MAG: hypothetical protein WKF77_10050 [Planctomycetaceae bacterium]
MKRKHYPVVTFVVATLLIVVPLLLLSLSLHGNSSDTDITLEESRDGDLLSTIAVQPTASKPPVAAIPKSRVHPAIYDRPETSISPIVAEQPTAPTRPESEQLPLRFPDDDVPKPADVVLSDLPEDPLAPELVLANFPQAAPVVADMGIIELPTRPDAGASYYAATGHLALRTQPQVPDPLENRVEPPAPPKEPQVVADADAVEAASEKSRKSKSRRSKSEEKKSAETDPHMTNSNPEPPVDTPRSVSKASGDNDALIEEVVIQTPLESALVGRVENVVAMTRARGWPIALIRSDLPDDVWWVQQVVGIQGNSFAARVNFGNEYTLSGSAFSLVIVFLDSPDEVRRFRIAKQFKDIPEGVRHSRDFHYIRN